MLPIRVKILILAFFSLAFLLLAITSEYIHVKNNVSDSQESLKVIEEVSLISQLIHSLQKERGLTATHLLSHNKELYNKLIKQRELTDADLKSIYNSSMFFKGEQNLTELIHKIKKTRDSVDSNKASWKMVKDFYSLEIDSLLSTISVELTELGYAKEISHQLYAAICLLKARENLGILRASISRFYETGELSQDDFLDISYKYGAFIDKYDYFEFHIDKTSYKFLKDSLNKESLSTVRAQIVNITREQKALPNTSLTLWWQDVTSIMNSMKEVETIVFQQIKKNSLNTISTNQKHLYWYIVTALIALVLITILTTSTVVRILKALSALISSLNEVERTQDFGLRVHTESKDEFSQLGYSINKLLDYVDQILKEKDTLASIDLLTSVMNRRSFIKIATREIERSNRYENPLSLIFCDIDNFKNINDTYGHNVGDNVLKSFAQAISKNIRKSDFIVRWGGEEFIVLAPQTDKDQATELAENLREIVMNLSIPKIKNLTCSFGVVQIKKDESLEELSNRADKAMFRAKKLGENQVYAAGDDQ